MSFSEFTHPFQSSSSKESLSKEGSGQNILLICGGQSPEHSISLISAEYIAQNIDEKHSVFVVVIDKQGQWISVNSNHIHSSFKIDEKKPLFAFLHRQGQNVLLSTSQGDSVPIDIVFPILHGPLGEDGTIQGMLQLLGVPFVGCDMRSSLMGMDKQLTKEFLTYHGIPVTPFISLHQNQPLPTFAELCEKLNTSTLFIKPAHSGSSIGVFHITNENQYREDIRRAFEYDPVVLVEKRIQGHEIECAVLGDTTSPQASCLAEIKVENDFYSYEAKYLGQRKVEFLVPAPLDPEITLRVRQLACRIFQLLGCSGMARIDFFVENDEVFLNEVNTIPGFTPISLYPQLWSVEGLSAKVLIQKLLDIGFVQFARQQKLVKQFTGATFKQSSFSS
jgi:D-alanine-D-alanine ligase